ncbi:uncharacterized protein E5676_scaffold285G00290 [Cucumis melo var. makuwa]|uniref:Uncharacterized protein n=1 Tax=Cucumis melo var. makuwa TaxID=1194695 RepID=A0A5A7V7G5_CUCMM|nr:uncharacterized protein E6C27_scaffold41G001740 [Cucumis melo var. makuwa]TYJ97819.1 uncharacterized protein E5676_scaffold285G00290 [Cucumis melo var. makuwa]
MSSSSILSSQSMAMAFAALSAGTVIVVLSLYLHKSHPSISSAIFSSTEELKRKKDMILGSSPSPGRAAARRLTRNGGGGGGMPANRAALYNGILRDRLVHRIAYSL